MKRVQIYTIFLVLFSIFSLGIAGTSFAEGPLSIHPVNPRYFTDDTGKTIYLAGSHTWYNIHYNTTQPVMSDAEFEEYLDWMQAYGHNFTRLWTGWANNFPKVWTRTGPGTASDGDLKFDLTQFDESYFDLVRRRVIQVTSRGMYCSVMFFGSAIGFHTTTASWEKMAWHPHNNINAVQFSATNGTTFFTTTDGPSIELQKMLIRKFIDTLNDQDNIIWEIANQGGDTSRDWQSRMTDYARSYEAGKPKQHLIGITGGYNFGTALLSGPADWISPDWSSYKEGGPANYTDKVVINDTDHLPLWGYIESGEVAAVEKWVWKAFTRGTNPRFMDPYDSDGYIDPMDDQIRYRLGDTIIYAEKMNLASMAPSSNSSNCSTTYCLRNPGKEYLIYQPRSRASFKVKLSAGTYSYEWFNPNSGNVERTGTVTARGGRKAFVAPFDGDAVLYLKSRTVNQAATTTTVSSSANPSLYAQEVTFTAAVASGAGTPTGVVQFQIDGTNFGNPITLSGGSATSSATSSLSPGNHTVRAVYGGDTHFDTSTGRLSGGQTVKQESNTTVSSSANPSVYGQAVTFTAAVASGAGTPTGVVQFQIDGTNFGDPVTLSGGSATSSATSSLTTGNHTVRAVYGGDTYFDTSTGTLSGEQAVNQAATSISVTSSANPSPFGQAVTFTAAVSATAPATGTPSGTVAFKDGATTLGTGILSEGQSSFDTSALSAGSYSITAVYSGDSSFNESTSDVLTQTIDTRPAGAADYYITLQDTTLNIGAPGVLGNDNDTDGNLLTAGEESATTNGGTVILRTDGSFTYTPEDPSFTGEDSFTYRVNDGIFESIDPVTVTISVLADTAGPVAVNDAYGMNKTSAATLIMDVLSNDNDLAGLPLTATKLADPAHGTVTLNADGTFSYTLTDLAFVGADSFTYKASNASNDSNTAMVLITVRADDSLVAGNDTDLYSTDENAALSVAAAQGVLANDLGSPLAAESVSGPMFGVLTLNSDGSFSYTPNAGFSGVDTFMYRASSGPAYSNVAMVTIRVRANTTTTAAGASATYGTSDQTVMLSAAVTSATGTVNEGTVTFTVTKDSTVIGSPVTSETVAGGSVIASYTLPGGTGAETYVIIAEYSDSTGSLFAGSSDNTKTLTVNKATPSFSNLSAPEIIYGDTPTTLGGAINAGSLVPVGSVSITLNGVPQTASIDASGGFSSDFATGALAVSGSPYTITYSYAGDANFNSVGPDTSTLTISRKDASVTPNASGRNYGDPDPLLTGTLSGFLAGDGITAEFSRTPGETVAGGPYTISAVLSPVEGLVNYNIIYNTADFTISTATPAIIWSDPSDITYGTVLDTTQLNAGASVEGTFSYDPPDGTVLSVGDHQRLHADFTPADISNYHSASMDVYINVLQ